MDNNAISPNHVSEQHYCSLSITCFKPERTRYQPRPFYLPITQKTKKRERQNPTPNQPNLNRSVLKLQRLTPTARTDLFS